jgi:hypothetical protein
MCRLCFSLGIRKLVPAVPRKSLCPTHALSTPTAVRPIIRLLTDLSQGNEPPLILTVSDQFTTSLRGFTFVRLSDTHLLMVMP